jgi:hypothetical protein
LFSNYFFSIYRIPSLTRTYFEIGRLNFHSCVQPLQNDVKKNRRNVVWLYFPQVFSFLCWEWISLLNLFFCQQYIPQNRVRPSNKKWEKPTTTAKTNTKIKKIPTSYRNRSIFFPYHTIYSGTNVRTKINNGCYINEIANHGLSWTT